MRPWLWCLFACTVVGCCHSAAEPPVAEEESEVSAPEARTVASPAASAELEQLARADPIAFLERCRDRAAREIHSYRGTLLMQDRVGGKVGAPERIAFAFREKP